MGNEPCTEEEDEFVGDGEQPELINESSNFILPVPSSSEPNNVTVYLTVDGSSSNSANVELADDDSGAGLSPMIEGGSVGSFTISGIPDGAQKHIFVNGVYTGLRVTEGATVNVDMFTVTFDAMSTGTGTNGAITAAYSYSNPVSQVRGKAVLSGDLVVKNSIITFSVDRPVPSDGVWWRSGDYGGTNMSITYWQTITTITCTTTPATVLYAGNSEELSTALSNSAKGIIVNITDSFEHSEAVSIRDKTVTLNLSSNILTINTVNNSEATALDLFKGDLTVNGPGTLDITAASTGIAIGSESVFITADGATVNSTTINNRDTGVSGVRVTHNSTAILTGIISISNLSAQGPQIGTDSALYVVTGSAVIFTGDIYASCGATGIRLSDGCSIVTLGDIILDGGGRGVSISGGSLADITGDIFISGYKTIGGAEGIGTDNHSDKIILKGNIFVTDGGTGVYINRGGRVEITGNISVSGGTGIFAGGVAVVRLKGDISVTDGRIGVAIAEGEADITVTGNLSVSDVGNEYVRAIGLFIGENNPASVAIHNIFVTDGGTGVRIFGGEAEITGNISASDGGTGVAILDGEADITGNISASDGGTGVRIFRGEAEITGNISVSGVSPFSRGGEGIYVDGVAVVRLKGDISVTDGGTDISANKGAIAYIYGTISSDGARIGFYHDNTMFHTFTAPTNTNVELPAPHNKFYWDEYTNISTNPAIPSYVYLAQDAIPPEYVLSVSNTQVYFSSLRESYAQPAQQAVTITLTGIGEVELEQPAAVVSYDIGMLSKTVLSEDGDTATLTIRPKAGLPVGSYKETISILCSDDTVITIHLSFAVYNGLYGDVNNDGRVNGTDVQAMILWINAGYPDGKLNDAAARVTDFTGRPDAGDVQALVTWINGGGVASIGHPGPN